MHLPQAKKPANKYLNHFVVLISGLIIAFSSNAEPTPQAVQEKLIERAELAAKCAALSMSELHTIAYRAAANSSFKSAWNLPDTEASYITGFKVGSASMSYGYNAGSKGLPIESFIAEEYKRLNCLNIFSAAIHAVEDLHRLNTVNPKQ